MALSVVDMLDVVAGRGEGEVVRVKLRRDRCSIAETVCVLSIA